MRPIPDIARNYLIIVISYFGKTIKRSPLLFGFVRIEMNYDSIEFGENTTT